MAHPSGTQAWSVHNTPDRFSSRSSSLSRRSKTSLYNSYERFADMATSGHPTFKHAPLTAGTAIRILDLYPSPDLDAAPVEIELRHVLLEPDHGTDTRFGRIGSLFSSGKVDVQYEAVSYVWGSNLKTHEILCSNKSLLVPYNWWKVLKHLRWPKKIRNLWVDAICIDQDSVSERSLQVAVMDKIYSRAKTVLIWLGDVVTATEDLMRKVFGLRHYVDLVAYRVGKVGSGPGRPSRLLHGMSNH